MIELVPELALFAPNARVLGLHRLSGEQVVTVETAELLEAWA